MSQALKPKLDFVDFLNWHERCSQTTDNFDQVTKCAPCNISFMLSDHRCYRKAVSRMASEGHKKECGWILSRNLDSSTDLSSVTVLSTINRIQTNLQNLVSRESSPSVDVATDELKM